MSAGGSGAPAEGAVDANMMLAVGIIGGLLGIYLSGINPVIGPVLSCLGAVCAILWGVLAIRSVASYGLGTGVPSIGYMSLGIGVIGALAGVGIIAAFNLKGLEMLGPILALVFAMLIGLLVAIVAKKIVGMKIPVMERCTAEIAGAAALSVLGFSAAIAQETFRHGDAAIGRIVQRAFHPLRGGCHRRIHRIGHQISGQRTDAFAAHGIALVGHCR